MAETALYIHIPFCDHKCVYCDFYSIITTHGTGAYYNALLAEMEYRSRDFSAGRVYNTIYFGGGTPSLMQPGYLAGIINAAKKFFTVSPGAEITMETNPGTVSAAKLAEFRNAGINRLSVGVQSFDAADLEFMTRIHDADTARQTIFNAVEAGFTNINIDLIFNLPNQTKEKWLYNLNEALKLPVTHVSAYSLILERGTILNKMVLDGKVVLQDDGHDADLYEETIRLLGSKGFAQYEVSNFALPGYECIHNNYYWHYKDYLSLGTSAHSFMGGKRWWNFSGLTFYLAAVAEKGFAEAGSERPTPEQMKEEFIMLALRSSGLDRNRLAEKFGSGFSTQDSLLMADLIKEGFVTMRGPVLSLTPKGYAVCDEILSRLSGS